MKTDRFASAPGPQPADRATPRADDRALEPSPDEPADLAMDQLCELDSEALRLLASTGC
jgi:hypothetical protein